MNPTAQLASDQADYEQAMMAEEAAEADAEAAEALQAAIEAEEDARAESTGVAATKPWQMTEPERAYLESRLWPLRRGGESYGAVMDRILRERHDARTLLHDMGVEAAGYVARIDDVDRHDRLFDDFDPDETLCEDDEMRAADVADLDGDAASALESVYGPND